MSLFDLVIWICWCLAAGLRPLGFVIWCLVAGLRPACLLFAVTCCAYRFDCCLMVVYLWLGWV